MATSRLLSRRRQEQGSKWARISIAALATIGVIDTGSITLSRWGWVGQLSCPGGIAGCDKVLNSPWGTILETNNFVIPLALFGLLSYSAVLLMAIMPLLPGLSENKTNLSRRTWWCLFATTIAMSVFSLLLMWIMVFKIEAFCLFCILSGFLSFTMFLLSLIGGGWDDPGKLLFRGIILSLIVLISGLIWSTAVDPERSQSLASSNQGLPPIVQNTSAPNQIALARFLRNQNIIMYSAYWCPHCHDQKELFGRQASSELLIVECAPDGINNQSDLCEEKDITGFPSWEINGNIESGVQSLRELAQASGYKGDQNF